MAEAALFGIAKSILKLLASPALDEFRLLWGHKADLEKLEDTVTTISNILEDADRKQATDAAVRGWLARLRIVLYEADDLFDTISAKILLEKNNKGSVIGKKVRRFVSKPYNFAFLVKTAHKVKAIREHMEDIGRDIERFKLFPVQTDLLDPTSFIIGRDETHSHIPKNVVIGREQETEDVVRMLLPDTSQELKGVSVISIIGIGGLGKTTLAKLIYNDERVQQGFELCMWACTNYFTPLKQVLRTLLKLATHSEPQGLDQLQSLFRKQIEGKRFLLVLDDVWDADPENWRELEQLLSSGKDGSMVLTTTRLEDVAKSSSATKQAYFRLQGMSEENAWLLFKKIAFKEEGDQISSEWEQFGRQIVSKCANVPLAIVIIASFLRKKGKEKYLPLVNEELSRVFPDEYKKITHVLKFSYKELSYPVKRCFGYCSLFPKDYQFEKDILVRLWIAQGFVEPLVNQSLEDRAEDYLFYLVDRCFFQLTTTYAGSTRYQMHDLMYDLATEVAGSESILVDQLTAQGSWKNSVRHVSINCEWKSMVDRVCSFSHSKSLRTFLNRRELRFEESGLSKLMSSFKSLRVLDLSNLRMKKVPTSIGELVHLRFLDLSENNMERLPGSVCSLCHLQSLILQECRFLEELPQDLGNLLSLRHLMLQGCHSLLKMPAGLAALTSLVTLDRLVAHNTAGGLKYLENLDNLSGSLEIRLPRTEWQNATTGAERSFLSKKSKLHTLHLFLEDYIFSRASSELDAFDTSICALEPPPNLVELWIWGFCGQEIPRWVMCLHNLVTLKLERCSRCVELPPLSHLPSLKELHISNMDSMVTIEDNKLYKPNSFYPSLETLSIEYLPSLTSWWLQAPTVLPAFPRLTKVVIQGCPKLTSCMPLFFPPLLITNYSKTEMEIRLCEKLNNRVDSEDQKTEVRKMHLPSRLGHLEIPTVNRNLFKGLKYTASLETLIIYQSFNQELQEGEEEEEGMPWKNLQKLRSMKLGFGETFSMISHQSLLNGFQHLTSLQELKLCKCKELYLSWRVLLCLNHLRSLEISDVEEVIDVDSHALTQTQLISTSMRELSIDGGEWVNAIQWKSFPFLEKLYMQIFEGLPEEVQHLSALRDLHIKVSECVVSLPHWMSSLSSLGFLCIMGSSSELKKRCQRITGEDWPKIQHIYRIKIR